LELYIMRNIFRLSVIAALCLASPASGFWNSRGSNYNVAISGGASYTGPGDVIGGATAWCGLRGYSAAYAAPGTGKAINIRRASDNATQDIVILSTGALDIASATTFCNATTCFVTEIYDQVGTLHVTQATAASQPQLNLSCFNSLPCLVGNGTAGWLKSTGTFAGHAQPYSLSAVFNFTTSANTYLMASDNARPFVSKTSANTIDLNCGSDTTITASNNVTHAGNFLCSGASSFANIDGTDNSVSAGTNAFGANDANIMTIADGYNPMIGNFFEGGFWMSTGFSSGNRTSLCHNQFTYWGTSTSC
jgi:hypothetical protein